MAGARKAAAKKIAAPKVASWPLGDDEYLSTPSISRRSTSTGPAVSLLRERLGLGPGSYDGPVRKAVMGAQRAADVAVLGIVGPSDWDLIVNGVKPDDGVTPAE